MTSESIAHSAAIDSEPIRARGVIVKYFTWPTETAFQYLYMLYFILKSCSLLCSSLKLKTGSSCPLTTQASLIIQSASWLKNQSLADSGYYMKRTD